MITLQLLAIIYRTDSIGIPKVSLRIEHRVLHGAVGDTEFAEALRTLIGGKFIIAKKDALSGDSRYFITARGANQIG